MCVCVYIYYDYYYYLYLFVFVSYLPQFVPPQFGSHVQSEQSALCVPWPLQFRVHAIK